MGGQVLEFHSDVADGKLLGSVWLPQLPLEADEAEASVAHEQLVRLVEASDPRSVPGIPFSPPTPANTRHF